jgi:hypothetical protein
MPDRYELSIFPELFHMPFHAHHINNLTLPPNYLKAIEEWQSHKLDGSSIFCPSL